jgi:hypothetical protein
LSAQQAIALDKISDEFIAQVEQAVASGSDETVTETWETAQREADSQFESCSAISLTIRCKWMPPLPTWQEPDRFSRMV